MHQPLPDCLPSQQYPYILWLSKPLYPVRPHNQSSSAQSILIGPVHHPQCLSISSWYLRVSPQHQTIDFQQYSICTALHNARCDRLKQSIHLINSSHPENDTIPSLPVSLLSINFLESRTSRYLLYDCICTYFYFRLIQSSHSTQLTTHIKLFHHTQSSVPLLSHHNSYLQMKLFPPRLTMYRMYACTSYSLHACKQYIYGTAHQTESSHQRIITFGHTSNPLAPMNPFNPIKKREKRAEVIRTHSQLQYRSGAPNST